MPCGNREVRVHECSREKTTLTLIIDVTRINQGGEFLKDIYFLGTLIMSLVALSTHYKPTANQLPARPFLQ